MLPGKKNQYTKPLNIIFDIRFRERKNNVGHTDVVFHVEQLALGDSTHGASASAGTAVQASTSVDHVVIITLRDSAHGAGVSAGTAADAGIVDNVCHSNTPPLKSTYILSQIRKKAMIIFE